MDEPRFIFVCCQRGAEKACKSELELAHPELRLAFSRPGFLTFKLTAKWPKNFVLRSTFARASGWSIGRVTSSESATLVEEALQLIEPIDFDQMHVWQRDAAIPGSGGFEPFGTELATTAAQLLSQALKQKRGRSLRPNRTAKADQTVLDVVLVEPDQWWIGWHIASSIPARWIGGVPPLERDDDLISRAYYKLAEAVAWSQFPFRRGDLVIELGSAPGGATEFLLEQDTEVVAVDPADLDPEIAKHPKVLHLKMRSKDVSKKELSVARWLVADLNVAPNYTLDTVNDFVNNQHLHLRGLILTLKLTKWELADELEGCRKRVKDWGFDLVKTRQLAFNRQEICLIALRDRMDLRGNKKRPPKRAKKNAKSSTKKEM